MTLKNHKKSLQKKLKKLEPKKKMHLQKLVRSQIQVILIHQRKQKQNQFQKSKDNQERQKKKPPKKEKKEVRKGMINLKILEA